MISAEEWLRILGGPHAKLAVWLPMAGFLGWTILARSVGPVPLRTRVWSLLALALLPGLVFVPPILRVVLADPTLAPAMARRLSTEPPAAAFGAEPLLALTVTWPFFLIPISAVVAFGLGLVEVAAAQLRVALLPKRRETYQGHRIVILEHGAEYPSGFTMGLIRPQIYLSAAAWNSPHRASIVAHEAAHAAARDPLVVFVARGLARTFWYLPYMRRLWRSLHGAVEMAADRTAVRQVGRRRYARALADLSSPQGARCAATLQFDGVAVGLWSALLVFGQSIVHRRITRPAATEVAGRLAALAEPRGSQASLPFWVGFALIYSAVLLAT